MHELSIALGIVEAACEEIARHPGERVSTVHLRLGPLAGVVREALLFSYEIACAGTPLEGTKLVIEDVPAVIYCEDCRAEGQPVSIQSMTCPRCGAPAARTVSGDELELAALELCAVEAV